MACCATGKHCSADGCSDDEALRTPRDARAPIETPAQPSSKNSAIGSFSALLDLTKTTQFGSSFQVTKLTQDGYTAGELTGVSIDQTGVLETKYSNGQTKRLAQLTLADFRNPQGLTPISGGARV